MKKYIVGLLVCGLALPAAAFDPLGTHKTAAPKGCIDRDITTEELTLDDLVQISLCTNPSLSAGYMGVKSSEATLGQARAQYLPTINLTGTGNITGEKVEHNSYVQNEPYSGKAEASWLLFDFGGREARTSSARHYVEAARYGYDTSIQEMVLSVQTAYLNLLAAQESLISSKASLDSYKQSYQEAEKRYKLGMVSLSDKLQANTRYQQAVLKVVEAENLISRSKGTLAVLVNLSPDTPIQLAKPTYNDDTIAIEQDDVTALMQIALEERPEIRAQQSTQQAAKSAATAQKMSMLPTISATGSVGYGDNWKHSNPYVTNNSAGLLVTMPLFTGFSNMYKVQQASYSYYQQLYNTQSLKLQIENEVWRAYQNYKTAVRSYEISQAVLESAEENHRVAFRYYELGKEDILNLLSAVAQLADARQNKITAFYSLLLSKANLYRSIGK